MLMFVPMGFFVTVDPRVLQLHAKVIKDALRQADIGVTKAAIYMDVDARQFARQLEGDGHISYTRLVKLPLGFWQWLVVGLLTEVGIPTSVSRAARLDRIVRRGLKKMARAEMDTHEERQRA